MGSNFFNNARQEAFDSGFYKCPKCGKPMKFTDEWEDVLVCEYCGYDMDSEHYGLTDEEYENLYPTAEEFENGEEEDEDE